MAKSKAKPSLWIDTLTEGVGEHFWLETTDGVIREGRISGFSVRTLLVNNVEVDFPTEIEVNGDSMDKIPLDRVKAIRVG